MNPNELTNPEYVKAVLAIQPDVIALTNKNLSAKAIKLVLADYEKWIIRCRDHKATRCWDSNCPGELEYTLEYKLAEERGASIVTARCKDCGNEYRLQDYEENLDGMKDRIYSEQTRSKDNIEYKAAEIKSLEKKLKEAREEKNALHLKHVLNRQLGEELGVF